MTEKWKGGFQATKFFLRVACSAAMMLVLCFDLCFATSGDILYQNCAGGSCTGAGSNTGWVRTVETSGCLSGECLRLIGSKNGDRYGAGSTAMMTKSVDGHDEITITWSIKYMQASRKSTNIKNIRPYNGSSSNYLFTVIAPYFSKDFYQSRQSGTLTPTSIWTPLVCSSSWMTDCMIDNGDGSYTDKNKQILGYFNDGNQDGIGSHWTTIREHIKMPSTPTASDGKATFWINGQLAWTMNNVKLKAGDNAFTGLTFYPSSEAGESFEHWMDEMIIYEGYVPPDGFAAAPPAAAPAPPADFAREHT